MLPPSFPDLLERIVGPAFVKREAEALLAYGTDGTKKGRPAEIVVVPGGTAEIAAIAAACHAHRVPLVVRGAGSGYTGGAIPAHGGVVLSMERLNRILEIDEENLLAVVEPNVITGDLQDAVERRGLFYPPDPASLRQSAIGGNVAECAGGPRAFKYGTTKRYVLGLEAVLPTGEVVRTGSKTVKNVVGYDLTQLLVGSEGTLAIITQVILRLVPKPPVQLTLRAAFARVDDAAEAVTELIRRRVVPATIELIDRESLAAVSRYLGTRLAPEGTGAVLLLEVDGFASGIEEEAARVEEACRAARSSEVLRAADADAREELWRIRRELSPSLKTIGGLKLNHDVVVPRGRVPHLFRVIEALRREYGLTIPCFGHAGDGNIHVNIMVDPGDAPAVARAREAERRLFREVVALEGSISGEHGIGLAKLPFVEIELSPEVIALSKRVKHAFDPHGILNPGKMFP